MRQREQGNKIEIVSNQNELSGTKEKKLLSHSCIRMYNYNCAQSLFTSLYFYLLIRAIMKDLQQQPTTMLQVQAQQCGTTAATAAPIAAGTTTNSTLQQRCTVFDDSPEMKIYKHTHTQAHLFYGQSHIHFQYVVVIFCLCFSPFPRSPAFSRRKQPTCVCNKCCAADFHIIGFC